MVAPEELNDDTDWTLVQSKKTWKERQKAKEENLTAFPPLPSIQKDDESMASLSEKAASSSKCSMKMMKLSAYHPLILTFLITSQSCLLLVHQKRAVIHSP